MNEFQQLGAGQQQLAPQGFFGSLVGAPLGGLIGRGIGGPFGNTQLGGQIGQYAGGIGGGFLPLSADPVQAYALAQQQLAQQGAQGGQLAPQGWLGNIISHVAKPLGSTVGGWLGHPGVGGTIGDVVGGLGGLLPFGASPQAGVQPPLQQQQLALMQQLQGIQQLQQHLQQQLQQLQQLQQGQQGQQAGQAGQFAPQGWFGNAISQLGQPLGGFIGGLAGNQQLGSTVGGIASQIGSMLPFSADPYQQQLQQQQQQLQQLQQAQGGQIAPQGWFGNAISQLGQPLGGFIGGLAGNQQLGSTIGGIASQVGSILPFGADPYAAYVQQLQRSGVQGVHPGQYPYMLAGQYGQPYGQAPGMGQPAGQTLH